MEQSKIIDTLETYQRGSWPAQKTMEKVGGGWQRADFEGGVVGAAKNGREGCYIGQV